MPGATRLVAPPHQLGKAAQQFSHLLWWQSARFLLHYATRRRMGKAQRFWLRYTSGGPCRRVRKAVTIDDTLLTLDINEPPLHQKVNRSHARAAVQSGFHRERVERWPALPVATAHRQFVAMPCKHSQDVSRAGGQRTLGEREHRTQKRSTQWRPRSSGRTVAGTGGVRPGLYGASVSRRVSRTNLRLIGGLGHFLAPFGRVISANKGSSTDAGDTRTLPLRQQLVERDGADSVRNTEVAYAVEHRFRFHVVVFD